MVRVTSCRNLVPPELITLAPEKSFHTQLPEYPSIDRRISEANKELDLGLSDTDVVDIASLIQCCLRLDPAKRLTAEELLMQPFFDNVD